MLLLTTLYRQNVRRCMIARAASGMSWLVLLASFVGAVRHARSNDDLQLFEQRIRPVLVEHCYECHSQEAITRGTQQAGLFLDSRQGLETGGDSGPAVDSDDPENSLLLRALRYESLEMPPSGRLSDQVIADFSEWIRRGMPDPRDDGPLPTIAANTIDWEQARQHWAYQPLRTVAPQPAPTTLATRIDQFISEKWIDRELVPQGVASRAELLRRISYDLTGLPPTPEQLTSFLRDPSSTALAGVVDELLTSPQFGERFGRHWLDLARYAESVTLRGLVQHQAWRYRDYVIRSFNEDKPYDQFIREQIAGDLLAAETLAQGDDYETATQQAIASTFLTLGNTNLEEQDKEQLRMDVVDEQLTVIGGVFLGQTLGCARCHDHKFDPISARDYYALAGILRNVQVLEDDNVSRWIEQPLPLPAGDAALYDEATSRVQSLKQQIQAAGKEGQKVPEETLAQWKKELGEAQQLVAIRPKFMAVLERKEITDSPLMIRGNVHNLGPLVPRGFLSVFPQEAPYPEPQPLPTNQSGRRELADWIGSSRNPLTARVMVNRLWGWLCGEGLVRTPDNFGLTGELPTHPELLDYLASRLIQQGWSIKAVVREIVLSDTYQRSSQRRGDLELIDPENRLWARAKAKPLSAEAMLDTILVLSGEIDMQMGGKQFADNLSADYGVNPETNRRAIYWPLLRNEVPEMMRRFDGPNTSLVTGKRDRSIVAPQALFLMNNRWLVERCQLAATRLLAQPIDNDASRIESLYQTLIARGPTKSEAELLLVFLEREQQLQSQQTVWARLIQAILATIDFRYSP